jgi:hypothetical protein
MTKNKKKNKKQNRAYISNGATKNKSKITKMINEAA